MVPKNWFGVKHPDRSLIDYFLRRAIAFLLFIFKKDLGVYLYMAKIHLRNTKKLNILYSFLSNVFLCIRCSFYCACSFPHYPLGFADLLPVFSSPFFSIFHDFFFLPPTIYRLSSLRHHPFSCMHAPAVLMSFRLSFHL